MLIYKRNVHTKNESSSLYRGRQMTFPPRPDIQTDIQTDISVYRVASLLISHMYTEIEQWTIDLSSPNIYGLFMHEY